MPSCLVADPPLVHWPHCRLLPCRGLQGAEPEPRVSSARRKPRWKATRLIVWGAFAWWWVVGGGRLRRRRQRLTRCWDSGNQRAKQLDEVELLQRSDFFSFVGAPRRHTRKHRPQSLNTSAHTASLANRGRAVTSEQGLHCFALRRCHHVAVTDNPVYRQCCHHLQKGKKNWCNFIGTTKCSLMQNNASSLSPPRFSKVFASAKIKGLIDIFLPWPRKLTIFWLHCVTRVQLRAMSTLYTIEYFCPYSDCLGFYFLRWCSLCQDLVSHSLIPNCRVLSRKTSIGDPFLERSVRTMEFGNIKWTIPAIPFFHTGNYFRQFRSSASRKVSQTVELIHLHLTL